LVSEIRNQAKSWLDPNNKRHLLAVATGSRLRAGLKRRKF
jgi:hypothetical protein